MEEMFNFLKNAFEGVTGYECNWDRSGECIMITNENDVTNATLIRNSDGSMLATRIEIVEMEEVTTENIIDFLNRR